MTALSLAIDTPDLAEHYETVSADRQFKAGQRLIEKLAVREGERVLDVGSGTGLLAEYVASLVGATGSVLAIDPLPLRIEIAKRRAAPNLKFEVGDAYELERLPKESFDAVYLNAVFHWLPEKLAPLRAIQRLLKPAGRLGISTGARDQLNTIQEVRRRVLTREAFRSIAAADASVAHHVTAEELSQLLRNTGFAIEHLALEAHSTHHPTAEAAIQFAQASSFGNYLGRIPQELRAAARREIAIELEKLRDPEGILQRGTRILALARKSP
jgi:arsenite methyltransferase